MDEWETHNTKGAGDPDNERLNYYHHGRDKMSFASKDIWMPMMQRNMAATAKLSNPCSEKGKTLKPDIAKVIIDQMHVPTELNKVVELDFVGRLFT